MSIFYVALCRILNSMGSFEMSLYMINTLAHMYMQICVLYAFAEIDCGKNADMKITRKSNAQSTTARQWRGLHQPNPDSMIESI